MRDGIDAAASHTGRVARERAVLDRRRAVVREQHAAAVTTGRVSRDRAVLDRRRAAVVRNRCRRRELAELPESVLFWIVVVPPMCVCDQMAAAATLAELPESVLFWIVVVP